MCEAAVGDDPVGGVRLASEERLRRVGEEVREREAQRDELGGCLAWVGGRLAAFGLKGFPAGEHVREEEVAGGLAAG